MIEHGNILMLLGWLDAAHGVSAAIANESTCELLVPFVAIGNPDSLMLVDAELIDGHLSRQCASCAPQLPDHAHAGASRYS
jgi:hypothetical protein